MVMEEAKKIGFFEYLPHFPVPEWNEHESRKITRLLLKHLLYMCTSYNVNLDGRFNWKKLSKSDKQLIKRSGLHGSWLNGAVFRDSDDLQKINFRFASMVESDLKGSDFSGSCFYHADLSGADMCGSNFTDCNFEGCSFHGASMNGAIFRNVKLVHTSLPLNCGSFNLTADENVLFSLAYQFCVLKYSGREEEIVACRKMLAPLANKWVPGGHSLPYRFNEEGKRLPDHA
jgi:hypothetical protein